jgi:hypothetical protein
MRRRLATVLAVIMTAAVASVWPGTANAQMRSVARACNARPAPVLCAIHQHRNAVWHYQRELGQQLSPYAWTAERAGASSAYRHWVKHLWYTRRMRWRHRWLQAQPAVPSWFVADMSCISDHEEYGMGGQNTIAGYFGLVSPPSGYIDPGPAIAARYGDSWLGVPQSAQLELSYALYEAYGWGPWSTAPACGL